MNNIGDSLNTIFVIEFMGCDGISNYVWDYNESNIKKFIIQHNMSMNRIKIHTVNSVKQFESFIPEISETDMLECFIFKSNHSEDIYHIMTSRVIVDEIMAILSQEFTMNMRFGTAILRNDVELFERIPDVIDNLDYGTLFDFGMADTVMDNDIYANDNAYSNDSEYYDNDFTYEQDPDVIYSLLKKDSYKPEQVQPITIEAYIHYFVKIMLEE